MGVRTARRTDKSARRGREGRAGSSRVGDGLREIACAVAGARHVVDLASRMAGVLELDDVPVALRLWVVLPRLDPEEAARYPLAASFPSVGRQDLAEAAVADAPVPHESGMLLSLRHEEAPVGVLELRGSQAAAHAAVLARAADVIGTRLRCLVAFDAEGPALSQVPMTDMVSEWQDVIVAFAAQAKRRLDHDRLSIYLLTPDGAALERFAVATSPIVPGEGEVIPVEEVGIARVIRKNKPIVSPDFGIDSRILGDEDAKIADAGFHGLVSVPLRLGERPFGLLNFVSRRVGFYGEQDLVVAQQIADQVAVFLQNLRLQHAVRLSVQREAVERERNRVSRELHDTVAQSLADIAVRSQVLAKGLAPGDDALREEAMRLHDRARVALEDVRRSLLDMIPSELEATSFDEAIRQVLRRIGDEDGLTTKFEVKGDVDRLPANVRRAVFRIMQEALTNVRKHARASRVTVALCVDRDLSLTIRDDGRGFSPGAAQSTPAGFGLQSMRERAEAVTGRLTVYSAPGEGTELMLVVADVRDEQARPRGETQPPGSTAKAPPSVIRVLIVDDHPMFRDGLANLLSNEQDMRVVGHASTGQEALAVVDVLRPDVILLDLELPDCSGADLAGQVGAAACEPVVLMMSAFAEADHVADALRAGVRGYISKTAEAAVLTDAIRGAYRGSAIFCGTSWSDPKGGKSELTPRELEILRLLVSGLTNAEIARELYLATKTIERIVATIVYKLSARNRAHAAAKAVAKKLVDARAI